MTSRARSDAAAWPSSSAARDTRLKRVVAIKLLPPELAFRGDIRTRFLREAEMAARLSHPNIVSIYSVDERDGLVFFVMGLVEGESLGERIRARAARSRSPTRAGSCARSPTR